MNPCRLLLVAALALSCKSRATIVDDAAAFPTLTFAPTVAAELVLDALRKIAAAGYSRAHLVVGASEVDLELAPSGDALVVTRFVSGEAGSWDIEFFVAGGPACSVIMESTTWKLGDVPPIGFHSTSLPETKAGTAQIIVVPRPGAPANELAALLVAAEATPLMTALHPKLRFDWTVRSCPRDNKFGHAN